MQRIEIKPNDQTYVGKKIRWSTWDSDTFFIPKFIGEKHMIGDGVDREQFYDISAIDSSYWTLFKEEEKRYAPAVYVRENGEIFVTQQMYSSREEAIQDKCAFNSVTPNRVEAVIWPARFDSDGFLILEE